MEANELDELVDRVFSDRNLEGMGFKSHTQGYGYESYTLRGDFLYTRKIDQHLRVVIGYDKNETSS